MGNLLFRRCDMATCRACLAVAILWTALLGYPSRARPSDEPLRLAIHVQSTVSSGELDPSQIAERAAAAGLDGVIFTDSAMREWEYGLWPLRGLLKWVVRQPSVLTFGVSHYARTIEALNEHAPGLTAIPGVEVAPFYYWKRSPFHRRGGQIRNWHQHLLVFGLSHPRLVRRLPMREFDPYHGNQGAAPYQRLIDFVRDDGGLVFWAHPMAGHVARYGRVEASTEPYPHLLEMTTGYHGLAIADAAHLPLLEPGGLWDRLLDDYSRGKRAHPTWIIGELDAHDERRPFDAVVTEVMATDRRPTAILGALREGRMWAVFRKAKETHPPRLVDFVVIDLETGRQARMGAGIAHPGSSRIRVSGRRETTSGQPATIILIRNGEVVQTWEVGEPHFDLHWDEAPSQSGFYRVIIKDPAGLVYTNPIFVR